LKADLEQGEYKRLAVLDASFMFDKIEVYKKIDTMGTVAAIMKPSLVVDDK